MLTIGVLACGALVASCRVEAQAQVAPCVNPGYPRLGVYGGGSRSFFDYRLVKLRLGDTFPNKKDYWAGLSATRGADAAGKHDIFVIYCGQQEGIEPEHAKQRIDAWLKPEQDLETYPQLIPAICLGEENVPKDDPLLEALARHVRQYYHIPVFQWYTTPRGPNPELTADGWIWDSYGMQDLPFRKHLMKFVSLGKPAICLVWAADPQWPAWTQYPDAAGLINGEWHQFRTCMEFNVSTAVFAVAGPGSVNAWLASDTPAMIALRNCLSTKRAQMHAFKPGELPLASANFSARSRSVPAGGDPGQASVYLEQFSGFGWIDDADLSGFLDMKLTSRPGEPGFLLLATDAGRPVEAALVYRFESYFPLQSVKVMLDAAAPAAAGCRNEIALSRDEPGDDWPLKAEQAENDELKTLVLTANEEFLREGHAFYLRVRMTNHAQQAGQPGNRLDRLQVECLHRPPPDGASAILAQDQYGNLFYEDDFSTTRWRHLGQLQVEHEKHGGYRQGSFWVGMVGGRRTSAHLVQRISSPWELRELNVAVGCYADDKNLGGHVTLLVAPRGKEVRWKASTDEKPGTVYRGMLNLKIPRQDLKDLRDFDVHVILGSTSGVEGADRTCARLESLTVRAQ